MTVGKTGTMRHIYQMAQRPWSSLGIAENVPVEAGENRLSTVFSCRQKATDGPGRLTFNLTQLTGKISIGDVMLEEIRVLPASALNTSWTVFFDVKTPTDTVPPVMVGAKGGQVAPRTGTLTDSTLDLAALNGGSRKRARAILFNEFNCDGPGNLPTRSTRL